MPRYDFRCPQCNLEFEVSRPFSRADEPAFCPVDGTTAARVLSMPMTFVKGGTINVAPESPGAGSDHSHGHSHGPGGHTH